MRAGGRSISRAWRNFSDDRVGVNPNAFRKYILRIPKGFNPPAQRVSFKNVNTKVASGVWHTLRVDFAGNKFTVTFDGKPVIEATDATFADAGKVGVWTKADSVTLFDDFTHGGR